VVDATTAWAVAGLAAAVVATVVLTIAPVRRAVEGAVERTLFPGQREARELIYGASRELARLRDVTDLGSFLRAAVVSGGAPSTLRLVWGPRGGPAEEVGAAPGTPALGLGGGDPIATLLVHVGPVRLAGPTGPDAATPRAAIERARNLGVHLVVPLAPTS